MTKEALVEALLFSHGSYRIAELAKVLGSTVDETREIVSNLSAILQNRGIVVVTNDDEVTLGTHPDASVMLEKIRKEELTGPLTKQALETLAIIAYGDVPGKSLVDGIRGVNSYMTLRNLIERGLIERFADPNDKRAFKYRITTDALRHLGVASVNELPGFAETNKVLVESASVPSEPVTVSE